MDRQSLYHPNSAEDWQAEAAMMGQVYASGFCNLAATAASEGSQGLFLDNLPTAQVLIEFNDTKDLWHLNEKPSYHWEDILNYAPLNWRGWIFQERFLSTRVIHFGRSRVYWECGKKKCCEWTGREEDAQLSSDTRTGRAKEHWQEVLNAVHDLDKDEAVNIWKGIVDFYSSHSSVTYVTDKLLAIAGLAKKVQESTKCRYLAGIWEHNIASQLLWDVGIRNADEDSSVSYVAPSWSWASVHLPIGRPTKNKGNKYTPLPVIEVLSIDLDLVTGNEFGRVKGGSMTLAGRLGFIEDSNVFEGGDNYNPSRFEGNDVSWDREGGPKHGESTELYLLVIEDDDNDFCHSGAGLALQHVGTKSGVRQENIFKRVGSKSWSITVLLAITPDSSSAASTCHFEPHKPSNAVPPDQTS